MCPGARQGCRQYEILLSESQERMLLVAARGREAEVRDVFAKWELDAAEIGRVTSGPDLTVRLGGEVVARVPVAALGDAPVYEGADGPARRARRSARVRVPLALRRHRRRRPTTWRRCSPRPRSPRRPGRFASTISRSA